MKSKINKRALLAAGIVLSCLGTANATDVPWTGANSTDWSDTGNWTGGVPTSTDTAVFSGAFSNQPTLTADTANTGGLWMTGTPGQSTTISGAFALNLSGNTINTIPNLGILVDNTDANTLTISSNPQLQAAQTWQNSSANLFTVSGSVATNAQALTLSNTSTGGTTLSGPIGGSGAVTVSNTGAGVTTFSSLTSNYSGKLTVSKGTLIVPIANNTSANGPLGNSALSVSLGSSGGGNGTLQYTGGSATSTKNFTMVTGGTGTFEVTAPGTQLTIGALIDGGGSLVKSGPGTLLINFTANASSYLGDTVINEGTITTLGNTIPNGSVTPGSGNVVVNANGTFRVGNSSGTAFNALIGTGTVIGNIVNTTVRTITLGYGDASGTFSGTLVNGMAALAIRKTGAGTQVLSGTNTNTGNYTISVVAPATSGGTLQFAQRVSLFNGGLAAPWSAANINVTNGTAAFNVGGPGEFTTADVNTLNNLPGYTATNGFANGTSFLGLDTTNATGGQFIHNTTLADTNGGANALGLKKLGTNVLTLGGANTYTGNTIVSGGTLELTGTHSIGAGAGTYSVGSAAGSTLLLTGGGISGTNVNDIKIGDAASTIGTFTNNGGTVSIPAGALYVGNAGTGHGSQSAGSTSAYILTIADQAGSSGDFTLNGGDLIVATDGGSLVYVGAGGTYTQNNGNLGAVAVYVDGAYNFNGGTMKVGYFDPNSSGLVQTSSSNPSLLDVTTNSTTIDGIYTLTSGTVDIGALQSLTVSEDATLSSGAIWNLQFDSGTEDFGLLSVGGSLDLGGVTLNFDDLGAGTLTGLSYLLAQSGSPILGSVVDVNTPAGYVVNVAGDQLLLQQVPEPGSVILLGIAFSWTGHVPSPSRSVSHDYRTSQPGLRRVARFVFAARPTF